jgi:alkyldihydroxyacetonephosphate synthase
VAITSAIAEPSARRKLWGWGMKASGSTAATSSSRQGVRRALPLGRRASAAPAPRRSAGAGSAPSRAPGVDRVAVRRRSARPRRPYLRLRSANLVRAFRRDYAHAPDVVAFPRDEQEVTAVLEWCSADGAAAIPFGGGSSVAGGLEPDVGDGYGGVVSVDLCRLEGVHDVEGVSRTARIAAGTLGPALEAQSKPHGFTLRHFPQSFEVDAGGWIATRSGGHFATLHTHIDGGAAGRLLRSAVRLKGAAEADEDAPALLALGLGVVRLVRALATATVGCQSAKAALPAPLAAGP